MNNPLVSVVLCTYNSEEYLAKSIASIISQSFTDFEFIIWDDGSTDNTRAVVESFNDSRIHYYYHKNTGLGMALRLACSEAKGQYIARMDSDDECLPERLKTQVSYLENHNEVVLVSSAVYYIDGNGEELGRSFPCSDSRVLRKVALTAGNMIVHPMVMMRRDAYERAGGYLPIKKSQDVLFWSRLLREGSFYNISTPLGKYRILPTSLDHSINPYKPVLLGLLKKMVVDDTISNSDIDLYNQVYQYSKKYIVIIDNTNNKRRKKSTEEKLYMFFKFFIGQRMAELFIVHMKNIFYLRIIN